MATSQTEIRSPAIELSPEALKIFCESLSGVLGVNIQCNGQQAVAATISDLEQRFKNLVAVDCVRAEGVIEGTLQFVFDREGLFTLAGIVLGLPEAEILENIEHGSLGDAEDLSDATREIGHLMASAWQGVFNERFDDQSHFAKISTFIGDPWNNAEEKIDVTGDEELLLVSYEMTIEPYPTFECGVILPETVFAGASVSLGEKAALTDQETEEDTEEAEGQIGTGSEEEAVEATEDQTETGSEEEAEEATAGQIETGSEEKAVEATEGQSETGSEEEAEEATAGQAEAGSEEMAEEATEEGVETETEEVGGDADEKATEEEPEASAEAEDAPPDAGAGGDVAEEQVAADDQSEESAEVSETIQRMTQSSASLPGQSAELSLAMPVEEIMQKEVVWGGPDDSVQQSLTKMQHHDVSYIMIGEAGVLDGIVSRSDLTGATSPYLRPIFAKWRRPSDDATLQIKIKWIMSRLVRTIKPQASVAAAIESMCKSGGGCLPVVDQQGKVQGLVTAFDVFKVLSTPGASGAGESSALRTSA